ncbi:MAG: hypothetical protein LAT67_04955 [Balneolales bacterium]|nr:hypothetical protein [Balneolales bacterium]
MTETTGNQITSDQLSVYAEKSIGLFDRTLEFVIAEKENNRWTNKDISQSMGLNPGFVTDMQKRRRSYIKRYNTWKESTDRKPEEWPPVIHVSAYFWSALYLNHNLNLHWIITGEGNMYRGINTEAEENKNLSSAALLTEARQTIEELQKIGGEKTSFIENDKSGSLTAAQRVQLLQLLLKDATKEQLASDQQETP